MSDASVKLSLRGRGLWKKHLQEKRASSFVSKAPPMEYYEQLMPPQLRVTIMLVKAILYLYCRQWMVTGIDDNHNVSGPFSRSLKENKDLFTFLVM